MDIITAERITLADMPTNTVYTHMASKEQKVFKGFLLPLPVSKTMIWKMMPRWSPLSDST